LFDFYILESRSNIEPPWLGPRVCLTACTDFLLFSRWDRNVQVYYNTPYYVRSSFRYLAQRRLTAVHPELLIPDNVIITFPTYVLDIYIYIYMRIICFFSYYIGRIRTQYFYYGKLLLCARSARVHEQFSHGGKITVRRRHLLCRNTSLLIVVGDWCWISSC